MHNQSPWVRTNIETLELVRKYTHTKRKLLKGSIIYGQDEKIDNLFFILDGRVKVSILSQDGQEKTLSIHEAGSFFGETPFFDQSASFSSAEALTDSTVLLFDREQVRKLFSENPEIVFHILESLGRKVRLLTFQVEYLSFMSVERQVAALLFSLMDVFGKPCNRCTMKDNTCDKENICDKGVRLGITITDQELGEMLGVRREAVTKVLNKLRKLNLMHKEKRILCCPDPKRLNVYLMSEATLS